MPVRIFELSSKNIKNYTVEDLVNDILFNEEILKSFKQWKES